jgi:hypothetical protein
MKYIYISQLLLKALAISGLLAMIFFIAFGWLKGMLKEREYNLTHRRRY